MYPAARACVCKSYGVPGWPLLFKVPQGQKGAKHTVARHASVYFMGCPAGSCYCKTHYIVLVLFQSEIDDRKYREQWKTVRHFPLLWNIKGRAPVYCLFTDDMEVVGSSVPGASSLYVRNLRSGQAGLEGGGPSSRKACRIYYSAVIASTKASSFA